MRLYLDESVSVVVSNLLQQHGVDCRTARDAGHLGATDEHQLTVATQEGRILFTHDTRDFLQLATDWHSAGKIHAGILLAPPSTTSRIDPSLSGVPVKRSSD